jgi:hypothetical protein
MVVSKRIPVQVDAEVYLLAKAYAEATGIPVARVVAVALRDWLTTEGADRLRRLAATKVQP